MSLSAIIQKKILELLSDGRNHAVSELKQYLLDNEVLDYSEGQFSGSINTLVRNGSIKKIERGVYSIKKEGDNMKKCFVVSQIGEKGSEIRKKSDQLYKYIISPICSELEFEPIRVDQLNQSDNISQTIIDYLQDADLVIADITGHNPNVFFEMGYRAATKKPIVYLREKNETIPFDIAGIRSFDYDLSDLDSVEEIKNRLNKTLLSFNYEELSEEDDNADRLGKTMGPEASLMISVLYEIQDEIASLRKTIDAKDTETIQAIVKASTPEEDPNTSLMKAILPELIKNPSAFKALMELGKSES